MGSPRATVKGEELKIKEAILGEEDLFSSKNIKKSKKETLPTPSHHVTSTTIINDNHNGGARRNEEEAEEGFP